MLLDYYPIKTQDELQAYSNAYVPMVLNVANSFSIDLTNPNFEGDHFGLQVINAEEFDRIHDLLLNYTSMTRASVIHNRRNRIYKFNQLLTLSNNITFRGIEIFEPKPDADLRKLKPGIEHCAFMVKDYDSFYIDLQNRNIPIDKSVEMNNSKFAKTSFVNLVEIEFRSDFLV